MNKKAQLTAFIIIGIVIAMAVVFIIYATQKPEKLEVEEKKVIETREVQATRVLLEQCLEDTSEEALYLIGIQGGYIEPEFYSSTFFTKNSYLYYNQTSYLPTKGEMEEEISAFIDYKILDCVNTSNLESMGIYLEDPKVKSKTSIHRNFVSVEMINDISIKKDDAITKVRATPIEINVRLGYIYGVVAEIIGQTEKDPNWVDVSTLFDNDLEIDVIGRELNTALYDINDSKSKLYDIEGYQFTFATLSNTSDYIFTENSVPQFVNLTTEFKVYVGEAFSYKVEAFDPDGDDFDFTSSTILFDIDPKTGAIQFIATEFDTGEHIVPIHITDTNGGVNFVYLTIIIE